ncbi:triacylglycerol lipase [Blastococcus sp. TF02A-26]|uniref:esterase/lipase family protein n=1 Tax=Blastococcus sp. TF02A-26 TaxID=2250577 RepID=UPI000DEB7954|nr:alpha/beta hydrolase [Blastococcus sp. TF02A-26]RBY86185.1 hypothetical protein DQ240_10375 [Blastococcus sp. TF02A-26]
MRRDEVLGLSELAGMGLGGFTRRVSEFQAGIAGRAFGVVGPVGAPFRVAYDAISGLAYGGVRFALGAGARAVGAVATVAADDRPLDGSPAGRRALGVLNGIYGDSVARRAPGLATPMTVRVAGRPVPTTPADLAAAFPDAGDRLVVFLHGLTETEASWDRRSQRHHGAPGTNYGTLLHRDLGLTPVFVRYNTGLHLSDNGRQLATLLADLVAGWPLPVRDVVLIGHSMGGLIARAALHSAGSGTADAGPWTPLVRDTITLGSPHLGAPLERGAHALTGLLARLPETRPLSRVLAARSVGIKDLRHGTLVEADWSGRDLDAREAAAHTHVPLSDGARHFVVLATLTRDPSARTAGLLGDLLVPPLSASGDTGDDDRLAFPPDHVTRIGGLNHFDLQNDPRVYRAIRGWLTARDGID